MICRRVRALPAARGVLFASLMQWMRRFGRRSGWRVLVALAACAWLVGMSRFLSASGLVVVTLPRQASPPDAEHNLASWRFGPTVRASSYFRDPLSQHHPLFLVDERSDPSALEKWASAPLDRHPWVSILWREPRELSRIVVRHAGAIELPEYTLARYTLTCVRDEGPGPSVVVVDNHDAVTAHDLPCSRARGVRLDVEIVGDDIARLFEIEAWGR